jgi:hypothetical protein
MHKNVIIKHNPHTSTDSVEFATRTQTRSGIRTRYLGGGRWSAQDSTPSDREPWRVILRGSFQNNADGHRAAADAWVERFIRGGEFPYPDAVVVNLGIAFDADDKFWTFTHRTDEAEPCSPDHCGPMA